MTIRYFKTSGREFSEWMQWAQNTYFSCCGCGLTHQTQIRVRLNKRMRTARVDIRMREHKARTQKRRGIMKRAGKPIHDPRR